MSRFITTNEVGLILDDTIKKYYNRTFVLVDENTAKHVLPRVVSATTAGAHIITIPAGEGHKTLDTLTHVWYELQSNGATRHSLLVNLGGGVVTDLGGMAAATFKRGIDFINIPTTLLAAVDAAVGGKTGINLGGLKNEIGVFKEPEATIVSSCYFDTLPLEELKSGYAEMLKHSMLKSTSDFNRMIDCDITHITSIEPNKVLKMLSDSINIKLRFADCDPHDQGMRQALNLGHTVGHALESHALHKGQPIAHGWAVAWGLVVEAVLSHLKYKMPSKDLHTLATRVRDTYGAYHITCDDYPQLLQYMHHDKKSVSGKITCTLLSRCGEFMTGVTLCDKDITTALDIYRDLMGI